MRRRSIAVLGLLLAALALAAAGCGGGKKNTAATPTAIESESTAPATTEAATTEAPTTEAAITKAATTTSNLSGIASAANCRELAALSQKFQAAFSGAAGGRNLKKEAELLQEFAKKVPSEIRADFQIVADYVSRIAEVVGTLKPGTTPDPATLAKLQKLSSQIDQAKLTQASRHISAWVQKNCRA
jgi:hypothetical protein